LRQPDQSGNGWPPGGQPPSPWPPGGQPPGGQPPSPWPPSGQQPGGVWSGGRWFGPRQRSQPNYGNVGRWRATFNRVVSASGWFAFLATRTWRRRSDGQVVVAHYNRWSLRTLVLPFLCLALGVGLLAALITGRLDPAPTITSIEDVYHNGAPVDSDDRPQYWVTLSGEVGSWSADAQNEMHPENRIYLLTDPAGETGIVVEASEPLGEPGANVEVRGTLQPAGFGVSHEQIDKAGQANPSVHLTGYLLDATSGAPVSFPLGAASVMLVLLGLFFLIGVPTRYIVFSADRQNRPPSVQDVPSEDAAVRLSGLVVDSRGKLVRLREVSSRISHGYYGLLTGPISVTASDLPPVEFELGEGTHARTGWVYPWRGPQPALQVTAGGHDIVLSFDSIDERNKWANLVLGAEGTPWHGWQTG
jgi:hypothetical protein